MNEFNNENVLLQNKMRRWTIGAFIVIMSSAAICGSIAWMHWKHAPEYSLNMIKTAVETHDIKAFDHYVDLDRLLTQGIDQLLRSTMDDEENYEPAKQAVGFFQTVKPALISSAKDQIRFYVEQGVFSKSANRSGNIAETDIGDLYKNTGGGSSVFHGVEYVKEEGKDAAVGIRVFFPKLDKDFILELNMRDCEDYWQLVEINNFGEFFSQIAAAEQAKLAEVNQPIVESMSTHVALDSVKAIAESNEDLGIAKSIHLVGTVKNVGTEAIGNAGFTFIVKDGDKIVRKFPVKTNWSQPLPVGQERNMLWSRGVNPFLKSDMVLYQTIGNLTIEVQPIYIQLINGTEQRLVEKLP
ncbi:hypothetical protein Ga0466249_002577 [Sporomusaceae bacterium BoRhaA]|uniref:hypothetical protein n=1 Tax=Pelorhabdus rhamnosifermentans TaxID=2772457 RepID=UPI001C061467|nr:hypothetical protein [Pelorhabdus rhamnosifermentans]MBU2701461.1 hypothetical protein [Pelorhabdus rhamnosifermentans]